MRRHGGGPGRGWRGLGLGALVLAALGLVGADDCQEPVTEYATVAAGSFRMGSLPTGRGADEDETPHRVTLTGDLEVGVTEVTQAEFQARLGHDPSVFPKGGSGSAYPVDSVSWFDALAYADRLSEHHGFAPCYALSALTCADGEPGSTADLCASQGGIADAVVSVTAVGGVQACEGYRLPTEAEWEYLARAGDSRDLPGGDVTQPGCDVVDPVLDPIGWYCGNRSGEGTNAVGEKAVSAFGLRDTHGNVAEWTWDVYGPLGGESVVDPVVESGGPFRSVRGGAAWFHGAAMCRSAERGGHVPGHRDRYLGFRVVRSAPGAATGTRVAAGGAAEDGPAAGDRAAGGIAPTVIAPPSSPPSSLPFAFTRPDVGTPLTPAEITTFTGKITGLWKDVGYHDWVLRIGHGIDASAAGGAPDFKVYWQDVQATKSGGTVTFAHTGGADNLMIRTSKILNSAVAGYLASGDPDMGRIVEQFSKGLVAHFQGMQWDADDPEPALMARAIFPFDHAYVEDGRSVVVDYEPVKVIKIDWNAHTIPNDGNPHWGPMWVRNMRSKDDVPHLYRTVPLLDRAAAEAPDPGIAAAAADAAAYLRQFARDVVDTGWYIRTKDMNGNAYVPRNDLDLVNDLASFVEYVGLIPDAECSARLSTALLGYGEPLGVDCGTAQGSLYELVAGLGHYFNYAIIRYFHAASVTNALVRRQDDVALALLEGMATRVDKIMTGTLPNSDHQDYWSDAASFLLVAASGGLPLTSAEARHVMEQYSLAVDHYAPWPNWDLWDASVPDGPVAYKPDRTGALGTVVRPTELTYLLEYCASSFRNPAGAALVDCDVVLDPDRWGEGA